MNRIRKVGDIYEVLITPSIKVSPDSALMVGNWSDENLRNYSVLSFNTMNDAMSEAFKYPDIDWYKLVLDHEHIFYRLRNLILAILQDMIPEKISVRSNLMSAETLKETMFERVIVNGNRFNLRDNLSDLISFTIVSPFTEVCLKIATVLEKYRSHLFLDELRIRSKKIVDGKIIYLFGMTDIGTIYQIKIVPTLLDQVDVNGPNYPRLRRMQENL